MLLALLLLIVFWPVLFEHCSPLPTDEFDTMIAPFSSEYAPPQAHNNTLTDAMMQSYPWKVYEQQALRHGSLAYWNPLILTGYPQYATSRQTFDVFNLLLLPFNLPFAFTLIIMLELLVAGCGMYVLLLWHGRTRPVALLFASGWMLNGMFLTHGMNLWVTATFCWVPFAIAMLVRYHQRKNFQYVLFSAFFLALAFLGSTLQSAVYVVFIIVVLNIFFALEFDTGDRWRSDRGRSDRLRSTIRRFLASTATLLAFAFALSAVMWLPSLELFMEVLRHGWLYSPTHYHGYSIVQRGLSVLLLGTFFVPELLGQVNSLSLTSLAGVHPLDFSGYVGFLETVMALIAVCSIRRLSYAMKGYAWLIILGFSLPIFTPLFSILYHRFFIVGTLGLIVSGASQFDRFLVDSAQWSRIRSWLKPILWLAGIAVIVLILLQTALALSLTFRNAVTSYLMRLSVGTPFSEGNLAWVKTRIAGTLTHYAITSPAMFVPFFALFLISILLWNRERWEERRWSTKLYVALLFGLTVGPMVFWWRIWLPMSNTERFPLLPQVRQTEFLAHHIGDYRIFVDRELLKDRQYVFLDNLPSMYGFSELSGYESEIVRSIYGALDGVSPATPHPKALGLFGIKYYLYLNGITPGGPFEMGPENLRLVDTGNICIYENPFARPHATLVYNSRVLANDSQVRYRLFDESLQHNEVLFTKGPRQPPPIDDTSVWEPATIVSSSGNEVRIDARPKRLAYLVLSDTYYPGWKCYVDGRETPIYRGNFSMRAVLVSPGEHQIKFIFIPASFRIGMWTSLASVLLLILLTVHERRRLRKIEKRGTNDGVAHLTADSQRIGK